MAAPMLPKWLRLTGYVVLGFASFVFFLYVHFFVRGNAPAERVLVPRLMAKLQQGGMKVTYDKERVEGDMLMGITLYDIALYPDTSRGMFVGETNPKPLLEVDKLRLRFHPLALLTGKLGGSVLAEAYNGTVKGKARAGRKSAHLQLEAKDLELEYYTLPNAFGLSGLKPEGHVEGTVDLVLPISADARGGRQVDLSTSNGHIDIDLVDGALVDSQVMGMNIPNAHFTDAGAEIDISEGDATIEQLGLDGDDLSVNVDGNLKLRQNLGLSVFNGSVKVKMSDQFEKGIDNLVLMGLSPGKQDDGSYQYNLRGPLRRIQRLPVRSGGTGRTRSRSR